MNYHDFIAKKTDMTQSKGIDVKYLDYGLFDFQKDLVRWALRRGKAAIFASTGLGKSRMQVAWANEVHKATGLNVLILAPLAVAQQTVNEAKKIGVEVNHAYDQSEVKKGITITNYDRLHRFDTSKFGVIVLDESSIIKSFTSKTLADLLAKFDQTPFKLACTATPAPNDFHELGNHAQFLNVCTRSEMLAEFFINDQDETQKWRLKGHAKHLFWKWVSNWGAMIQSPADLGYDDTAYRLPELTVIPHVVEIENTDISDMWGKDAVTLLEQRQARRDSMDERVNACSDLVNSSDDIWLIWCDLNNEGDKLEKSITGSIQIKGSDTSEFKERELMRFANGETRVLISKPSICGFGLNFQVCHKMAFVGVTNSFEQYYQAVRRCWRFGQKHPVDVHIIYSDKEGRVIENLKRKEMDALNMYQMLSVETKEALVSNVIGNKRQFNRYESKKISLPPFLKAA